MLHVLHQRRPAEAQRFVQELAGDTGVPCLREAEASAVLLDNEGFVLRPSWLDLLRGARPPAPRRRADQEEDDEAEPGEWPHGW